MKKNFSKILVLVLSLALLVGAVVSIVASAENTPEIIGKNIQYGADLKFQIAVSADSVGGADKTVVVNFYEDATKAKLLDSAAAVYTDTSATNLGVDNAYVALSNYGISALAYNTEYYIEAVCDNKASAVTYSAVEYFLERLYGDDVVNATTEKGVAQKIHYQNTLNYGSSAQTLAALNGKYDGKNVADYRYFKVNGGTANGVISGAVVKGTEITLGAYTGAESGVTRWNAVDALSGESLALAKPGEKVVVNDNLFVNPFFGFRGTGLYTDKALGFDDVTDVYNDSRIGFHCADRNALSIVDVKNDKVLKTIGQNTETDTIIRVMDTIDSSTGLVFETDMYFESVATTRSDKAVMAFGLTTETGSHYNLYTMGFGITYVDGKITLSVLDKTYVVEAGEWMNIRYELDYLKGQSAVRFYINGELFAEGKNSGGSYSGNYIYPTGMVMYNNGWNTTGTVTYLDNAYFGPLVDETNRGSGVYANNENTFTMDDVTGDCGSATTTNANIGLINKNGLAAVKANGDAAIQGFGSSAYQNDVAFQTSEVLASGDAFVAEFDIMFSNFNSTRAGGEVLSVVGSNSITKQSLLNNMGIHFKMVDGKCVLVPHSRYTEFEPIEIEACKWYTIRYEIEDVQGGKAHRIYVNGECVLDAEGGGVYSGTPSVYITGIDFYGYWHSAYSEFYIDNVYVGRP